DLLSDTDPSKPPLLAEMAKLQQVIDYHKNSDSSARSTATPAPAHANRNENDNISLLRRAAETAVMSGEKTRYVRYLILAKAEARRPGMLEQAAKDTAQAIRLYNGFPAPSFEFYGHHGYPPYAPLSPGDIAYALSKNGDTVTG